MPLFGIVFMVICIYMFSRFFGASPGSGLHLYRP